MKENFECHEVDNVQNNLFTYFFRDEKDNKISDVSGSLSIE